MSYSRMKGSSLQETASLIREFNKRIKRLKDLNKQIGTEADTRIMRSEIRQNRDEAQTLSKDIMNALGIHKNNTSEKSQYEKLSKEFQQLFQQYNQVNKETLAKEKDVTEILNTTLNDEEFKKGGIQAIRDEHLRRQSLKLQEIGSFDEVVLRERQDNIKQIEKDIVEVNSMFKDVAKMVNEQGTMLNKAEEHVDNAVVESGKAVNELNKADNYQRSSKKKLYIILGLVFCLVLIVSVPIIATSL
jgi:syntaxin 7